MASFIALQDNGNSYVASKLRNRFTVASSGSSHKNQYILVMELKITKNYSGYQSIWSMVDAENNACGTLAIKIRNGSPITSFPSTTTEISWLNLKKGSSTQSPPIIIATKTEFDIDTDNPYITIKLYFQPNRTFVTAAFSIIQESYNCQILQKIAYPTEASYVDNYQGILLCTSNVIMDNYNSYTNADSATKLNTARTIGITGGATGTATSFDGSKNINIPVTSISPNYLGEGYTTKRFMLQTSAEAAGVVIPYLYNDLAHLLKKGGSVNVYYDNTLATRAPIVTIMGHVDHGKTSLLDYLRKSHITNTEKGGITQHISAYRVETSFNRDIIFLATPGHEAFVAMRNRGANITDIIIVIISAIEGVQPQTKEVLQQAKLANVPIVFAINKMDKEGANPEKVKEELASMNFVVEDWGGKYQCQCISAKTGEGINELLEKILLEADVLDLKAHESGPAQGVIIESTLEKGRGYSNMVLVQDGLLKIGDIVLAGINYGKVKALTDSNNKIVKTAGPSTPVALLGLNGAVQVGSKFIVMNDEKEGSST